MPPNQLPVSTINSDTYDSCADDTGNMYTNLLRMVAQTTQVRIHPRLALAANNVLASKGIHPLIFTPPSSAAKCYSSIKDCKDVKKDTKETRQQLPCLPVPKLGDTMERFLESCKPLLSAQELKDTARTAQNFAMPDGQACKLQCQLLERAKVQENWLADWWMNFAYLEYRNSLLGWSSPGTPFAYQSFDDEEEWIKYSANVVLGALEFNKQIVDGTVKQEKMGKMPLDMQQYYKILGTCRMPGEKSDCLQYNCESKHIVVACNNHFYKIEVYDDDNCAISQAQLIAQLTAIVKYSKEPAPPVGILTATHRDTWGTNYKNLISGNKCNQACVRYIQKALFLLCLDKKMPDVDGANQLTISGLETIHGGGSNCNTANRWFDKCIQFVVSRNGYNGITYEHSPAEGGPVTTMGDFIQDYIESCKGDKTKDACLKDPIPRTLIFKVSEAMTKAIECAQEEVDKFVDNFDLCVFKFDDFGKEAIKAFKLSPDSFLQVAFQLAYYRLHFEAGATYETAAMRHFLHGRTETIRSATCASTAFAQAMVNEDCTDANRILKLRCAITAHKNYVKAALEGNGVDRHLLGLKMIALEKKIKPHAFFESVGYVRSSAFKMATSQVPTKHEGFMGYGPTVMDGYGICYNPRPDDIIISVASYRSCESTSTDSLCEYINCALKDMQQLLCNTQNKCKL